MLCCAEWEARHLVDHQVTNKGRDDAQNVGPSWNLSVAYFTYAWRRRNTRFKDLKLSRNMSKFVAQSIPALYFLEQLFSTRNKCFCCVTSWSRKVKNTKYRPKTYGDALLHEKLRVFCISYFVAATRAISTNSIRILVGVFRLIELICAATVSNVRGKKKQLRLIFNLFGIRSDNSTRSNMIHLHSIRQKRRKRLEIYSVAQLN